MSPPVQTSTEHRLIRHLKGLAAREDRGALAALRRGLGGIPGTVVEMHPHVRYWIEPGARGWWEDTCYIIAALFASHPDRDGRGFFRSDRTCL